MSDPEIWRDFPELVPGIVLAAGITHDIAAGDRVARLTAIAPNTIASTRTASQYAAGRRLSVLHNRAALAAVVHHSIE